MQKIIKTILNKDNKGQALLFVVVALAISMVVGVSISTRTLSLSKRVSSTDTHSRVYYAAEAGIERYVDRPMDELLALSSSTATDCGDTGATLTDTGSCVFDLGSTSDIETVTEVTVEAMTYNEDEGTSNAHYSVQLRNGSFASVNLRGYTGPRLYLCWSGTDGQPVSLSYSLWVNTGLRDRKLLNPSSGAMSSITGGTNTSDGSSRGYTSCYTVTTSGSLVFMNVSALGSSAKIGVFPRNSSFPLPPQGFRITSKAKLKNDTTNQVQVTKVIEVVRSYNHAPGFFDAAIYAQGQIMD